MWDKENDDRATSSDEFFVRAIDNLAIEDERTINLKANWTFIHFKLHTCAQANVLPKTVLLTLKKGHGYWNVLGKTLGLQK